MGSTTKDTTKSSAINKMNKSLNEVANPATLTMAPTTGGTSVDTAGEGSGNAGTTSKTPEKAALCFRCNKTSTLCCSGCKNARYCSSDCQKKDWNHHKLICKSFANLSERPTPKHFRGLMFAAHEDNPRFVRLEQKTDYHWNLDFEAVMGPDTYEYKTLDFNVYGPLRRRLSHSVALWYDENFRGPFNMSLAAAQGPKVKHNWYGQLLAQGYQYEQAEGEEDGEETTMVDLDTAAITYVIDHLKWVKVGGAGPTWIVQPAWKYQD
jgi:hypothetical protein